MYLFLLRRHVVGYQSRQPLTNSTRSAVLTGSTFIRAPVSSRTIRRCLAERHLRSRCPLRLRPLTPTHRCLHLEWSHAQGNWTAAEWNQVVFGDESRFNLSSDNNRVRVWSPVVNSSILPLIYSDTAPTADLMVWGVIDYNTRSPLVLINGSMTAQQYIHDILQSHVLPLMQRLPGVIFQQDNARPHTARVSHKTVSALLLPFFGLSDPQICLQSSISGILWGTVSWASHEFQRTRGKVTANME
ncbi:transposable element Tcb1 transposase [Trichonephila clavipes]|nr:transposable element Tcb1 transposase [Trichonephila clavipes]